MIKCPNCGTMNEAGSRFCYQCGQALTGDSPAGNGERTQPVPPPPFPPAPSFPGAPGPVSGSPPHASGLPQASGYPQDQYVGGGYAPPGGYPPGTPPGYMMPPEPPRRRRWLWIVLGILLGCILVCVALGIYGATTGGDTFERWGTQLSEFSTEEANN